MGAYTCQFGFVHKVCRCPTPHTIACDKVAEHSTKPVTPEHNCLVLDMWLDGRNPIPKHLSGHLPHDWWYTSYGGGHQLDEAPAPGDPDNKGLKKWRCPGMDFSD